ncbi:hypothetical protein ACFYT9_39160, partial [Streptomyces sp. NPDC004435]
MTNKTRVRLARVAAGAVIIAGASLTAAGAAQAVSSGNDGSTLEVTVGALNGDEGEDGGNEIAGSIEGQDAGGNDAGGDGGNDAGGDGGNDAGGDGGNDAGGDGGNDAGGDGGN